MAVEDRKPYDPPPLWMTALEARAAVEYASWRVSRPFLERMRAGDGHPVLVLPGFTAADRSTAQLRGLLRHLGYRTYGWGLGANLGPTRKIVKGMRSRVEGILDSQQQPISIVGWSLGGVFGRMIAREQPGSVRQVITLGSPFRIRPEDRSAASNMWDSLSPMHDPEVLEQLHMKADRPPLPVPTTSIYSRTDGIVYWRACLETKSDTAENVEVYGSHCGLGFNSAAAFVVADRLRQPADQWRRFRPPPPLWGFYPRPANHRVKV